MEVEDQARILNELTTTLRKSDWKVELEPRIDYVEPDIVATDPDKAMYVIEVKTGNAPIHTGVLGQLNIFNEAVKAKHPESSVRSLLLTTSPVDDSVSGLAGQLGLEIVKADSTAELSSQLASYLHLPATS